ncbi:hypothetical protein C8F04DRAFT_940868 [Mycena alexandri]|uniref:NADAR domain-containing protein n=1 Tax=Mycena alexandri TaxID=1745969 RepID=A0AAD6TFH1_9AGAR|nr:hypothetical protein C8F04DRAFT_940868 [Mycena alexandri]
MPSHPPQTAPKSPTHRRPKILFYHIHDPHYGFTNFSAHPVQYKGKRYPTSEHLFQAFKFMDTRPDIAEKIREISEFPRDAFKEARTQQAYVRSDWKDVNIAMMDIAVEHKFAQHDDLKEELLMTGDAELVEDSAEDAFWGIGNRGSGRNELGKALERLRTKIRSAQRPVILFYDQRNPYYSFTNLSPHPVAFNGEMYPTSEHLFQAFKFLGYHPDVAQAIRLCKKPSDAWAEAGRHKTKIRADWHDVRVEKMDIVLWQKFNQHPQLKQELLATGDADLVEDSPADAFWGRGKNLQGRNELGKALQRLRTKLRKL